MNGKDMERRTFQLSEVRVVDGEGDAPPRIEGYAAVFGEMSEDLGGFREIIEPGFFDAVLGDDVRALWNHNPEFVLGRTKSDTLTLEADENGLKFAVIPPETNWASDALVTMRRGDVDKASFAFDVREKGDTWEEGGDGIFLRTLLSGGCEKLYDVSPVTFPAYQQTSAQVRAHLADLRSDELPVDGQPGEPPEIDPQARADDRRRRLRLAKAELEIE